MLKLLLEQVNIVKIIVLITFSLGFINIKYINKTILLILSISIFSEIFYSLLMINNITITSAVNVYVVIHSVLWFKIIEKNITTFIVISLVFICFAISNVFWIEGFVKFNTLTFILGAAIYLFLFLILIINNLKNEKFILFKTNYFILISSPVLFFVGLSFIFGFKSKALTTHVVFNNIKLYTLINYFVNIIYYSLINIYIYRERKLQHA